MDRTDYFIIAAEPSADAQGKELIRALKKTHPNCRIIAVAGPKMREEKVPCLFPMEKLLSMGFIDIIRALPRLTYLFFKLKKALLKLNPRVIICIDYPGFNLRLQSRLRKAGFKGKLIHYVSPTVWAWSKKRIPLMVQNLDHLLTIFPFEAACYQHTTLNVSYVGNPLVHKVTRYPPKMLFEKKCCALFPGSRKTEIERNLPLQLKAVEAIEEIPSIALSISHEKHRT